MNFLKKDSDFGSGENISVISAECYFQGTLNIQGALRVDGKLDGTVDNASHIVVGEHGVVVGDLTAKSIVVSGSVQGDICADNLQIFAGAKIEGDIRAKVMSVEAGSVIKGQLDVKPAEEEQKDEEAQ